MDNIKLPETVKNRLIRFLNEIPVEEYSEEWRAVQVAITMILAPDTFKDQVHVFFSSHDCAREEGYYNNHEMSIRIWPHKLQMRRYHEIWSSWNGTELHDLYRYTFPGGKHSVSEFEELISYTGGLFYAEYSSHDRDGAQHSCIYSNFKIETNVK